MPPSKHDNKEDNKADTVKGCGCLVVIILIIAGWIASCGNHDDDKDPKESAKPTESSSVETTEETPDGVDESAAEVACQMEVKNNLTDPSHAKFHNLNPDAWKSRPVENGFKVESYVDAKNELGGTVRDGFGCTVTQAPGDEEPTVVIDWMQQL